MGLYALTLMEREGAIHGYGLSERIAERTEGAWRPGPGSVYPSLAQLVSAGLARSQTRKRRREYTITSRGRALLSQMRRGGGMARGPRPDLSPLWAEVFGSADVERFLLLRLRRTLDSLEGLVTRSSDRATGAGWLRAAVRTELDQARVRFRPQSRVRTRPFSSPRGVPRAG